MAIVTTITELKKYITTDGSFDFSTVLPYVELAEDELKRVLGPAQYDELSDYYNTTPAPTPIAELVALLPYAQRAVVHFAFLKGLDKFNVSIGNNGIGVVSTTQLAPASEKRVENLRTSVQADAWDALEYLLQFLEDNKADYPLWEDSDAYAYQYAYLISSARKFDELYKINRSRLTFLNWRPTMADVELLYIAPQISTELVAELKTQIEAGTLTDANAALLPYVQKALAYLTAASQDNPAMETRGTKYLMVAKTMLDAAPTSYPTYAASSAYDSTLTNYQPYENEEDSLLGVFG